MLNLEEVVEALRLRTWSVDCPVMKLGRLNALGLTEYEYEGCGYLKQAADGSITYKLYLTPHPGFTPYSILPNMVAGRLLGSDSFHRLDAVDMEGNVWHVGHTMPSSNTSGHGGQQFRHMTGEAYEIRTTCPQVHNVSSLKMMFFTEERVPGNAATEVSTKYPDGNWTQSSSLDTAVFSTASGDFSISNRPGMLVVKVVSPEMLPAHFGRTSSRR